MYLDDSIPFENYTSGIFIPLPFVKNPVPPTMKNKPHAAGHKQPARERGVCNRANHTSEPCANISFFAHVFHPRIKLPQEITPEKNLLHFLHHGLESPGIQDVLIPCSKASAHATTKKAPTNNFDFVVACCQPQLIIFCVGYHVHPVTEALANKPLHQLQYDLLHHLPTRAHHNHLT